MALSGQTGWIGKWDNTHRYFIEWEATQNIENNTSLVTVRIRLQLLANAGFWNTQYQPRAWTLNVDGQTASGAVPAQTSHAAGGTYTLATRQFTIVHGSDGTKSFSISGTQDTPGGAGTVTMSGGAWALDAIPRATTITSVANIDTAATTIAVTIDRKTPSYTHTITLKIGSTTIATWTGTAANFTGLNNLTISAAQRTAMLNAIPDAVSKSATLTVTTMSGSTTIGTASKAITVSVHAGAVPTLTTANFALTLATQYQISNLVKSVLAQNVGLLSFSAPWAMAQGATLASRQTTFDGKSSTSISGDFSASQSGTLAIVTTATDSRGRSASVSKNVTVLPYTPVALEVGYVGRGSTDTRLKVELYLTVMNFNSENKYRLTIETKPKGSSTWTNVVTDNYTGGTARVKKTYEPSTTYSATTAYDVRIRLLDELTTATVLGVLDTSGLILALGKSGVGMGKLPAEGRQLDVYGDIWDRDGRNLSAAMSAAEANISLRGSGAGSGVVFNELIEEESIYLLFVGRDQGLYLISEFGNSVSITPILVPSGTAVAIQSTSGRNLKIDLGTRTRTWALRRIK